MYQLGCLLSRRVGLILFLLVGVLIGIRYTLQCVFDT